ncbi:MAG: glycosyltransferase family 39 protein, partial [Anaerolineae bacterium]
MRLGSVQAKKLFTPHVSLFILLLAFGLRLYRLDFQSIWWDEGHSILMASAPVAQIPTLPGMDVHPPGYFVALHGWMALAGRSEFALRYLSVVFSLLGVAMLIRFGRAMGGRGAGKMAGLLAALSPFYVAYAQEVRMYAMVTFFAAAGVWFLWRLVVRPDGRSKTLLAGYVLTTAASLYTHYFTLFLLAFENLAWLVWAGRRWRRGGLKPALRRWVVAQAGVGLLFGPQLLLAARQITAYANPNLQPPTLGYYLIHNWQAYTLGLTFDPARAQPYLWTLAALLLLAIIKLRISQSPISPLFFLPGWLVVPLAVYFAVLQRRPSYEPRYMML